MSAAAVSDAEVRQPVVLIVDNDASKRIALRAALSPLELEIVEADSGRAALRGLMVQDFACILLDIRMPGMNGFETAAVIRKRQQSEHTPIIFITAHAADDLSPLDGYPDGAVDFMTAPVRPDELRAKVTVYVERFVAEQVSDALVELPVGEAGRDRWRFLVDHLPVGVYQTDDEDRFVYTNARWTALTGIAPADAVGWTAADLLGAPAAAQDATRRFELAAPDRDRRLVEMTRAPVPAGPGSPAGWVGTLDVVGDDTPPSAPDQQAAVVVAAVGAELRESMRSMIVHVEDLLARVGEAVPPTEA